MEAYAVHLYDQTLKVDFLSVCLNFNYNVFHCGNETKACIYHVVVFLCCEGARKSNAEGSADRNLGGGHANSIRKAGQYVGHAGVSTLISRIVLSR